MLYTIKKVSLLGLLISNLFFNNIITMQQNQHMQLINYPLTVTIRSVCNEKDLNKTITNYNGLFSYPQPIGDCRYTINISLYEKIFIATFKLNTKILRNIDKIDEYIIHQYIRDTRNVLRITKSRLLQLQKPVQTRSKVSKKIKNRSYRRYPSNLFKPNSTKIK